MEEEGPSVAARQNLLDRLLDAVKQVNYGNCKTPNRFNINIIQTCKQQQTCLLTSNAHFLFNSARCTLEHDRKLPQKQTSGRRGSVPSIKGQRSTLYASLLLPYRVATLCAEWEAVLLYGMRRDKPRGLGRQIAGLGKTDGNGALYSDQDIPHSLPPSLQSLSGHW